MKTARFLSFVLGTVFSVAGIGLAILLVWRLRAEFERMAGEILFLYFPAELNMLQALIQRYVSPWIWSALIVPILELPFWLVGFGTSLILVVLGTVLLRFRSRRRGIFF